MKFKGEERQEGHRPTIPVDSAGRVSVSVRPVGSGSPSWTDCGSF